MNPKTNQLVKTSLFLALGLIIPYIFHITGLPGQALLPMHIPVLLCGFLLGPRYGLIIGVLTPILNSLLIGMPPIYPVGIAMALELAAYGFAAGFFHKNKRVNLFVSLIIAMLFGRIISGIANYILLTAGGKGYALSVFLASNFINAIWGILLQLILIPVIVKALERN